MLNRLTDKAIYWLASLIDFLDKIMFRMVSRRIKDRVEPEEQQDPRDRADDLDSMEVALYHIDLGDFQIECPECGDRDDMLAMGLAVLQADDDGEEHFELSSIGIVVYECGDAIMSPCLTDKVGRILNAHENHTLRMEMFSELLKCEEHGVYHTEE